MKAYLFLLLISCFVFSCSKPNIEKTYKQNEKKVSITNGVWGTVSFKEGNCMPGAGSRTCKEYLVQRKVRIYAYTTLSQATNASAIQDGFYSQFSTQLIKETEADSNGFFEAELAPGTYTTYTLVVIEDGKLYSNRMEETGDLGINPITVSTGSIEHNVVIDYKAAY